jgi:hypothetical protein
MQLLSMIRESQGQLDEALTLETKVLGFRKARYGGRFRTCESLCRVGRLLFLLNQPNLAA